MKIYWVSQTINLAFDTFDSMVVIAKDEYSARRMNPGGFNEWSDEENSWVFCYSDGRRHAELDDSWALPEQLVVECIGVTNIENPRVVCTSFNAG